MLGGMKSSLLFLEKMERLEKAERGILITN